MRDYAIAAILMFLIYENGNVIRFEVVIVNDNTVYDEVPNYGIEATCSIQALCR